MVFVRTEFDEEQVEPDIRGGGCLGKLPVLEVATLLGSDTLSLTLLIQMEIVSQLGFLFLEGGS